MKKLVIPALVALAAFSVAHQGVTVNGKASKGVKVTKVKQGKNPTMTTTPKKHRKKFLGIF